MTVNANSEALPCKVRRRVDTMRFIPLPFFFALDELFARASESAVPPIFFA